MVTSDKKKKRKINRYKNQDKFSHLSKISYLTKIFDIMLPNLDPRPKYKNMVKNKQHKFQIKLKLQNNTN